MPRLLSSFQYPQHEVVFHIGNSAQHEAGEREYKQKDFHIIMFED